MSWQSKNPTRRAAQEKRENEQLRDQVYRSNLTTNKGSLPGGLGGIGGKTQSTMGINVYSPKQFPISNKDEDDATQSNYEYVHAIATSMVIVPQSGTNSDVKWIVHTAYNGQLLLLTPQESKTITLKAGGNINISSDMVVADTEIIYLQWHEEHPTTNSSGGSYTLLKTASGGITLNTIKQPCRVATTGNNVAPAAIGTTVDGVTIVVGNRVLYKNQTNAAHNGIYECTLVVGIVATMVRASDFDSDADVKSGVIIHVEEGTVNGDKNFQLATNNPITLDTTNLAFADLNTTVDESADYVWTGSHKFQRDPTGSGGSEVFTAEFGNSGTDRLKFIGEITGAGDAVITDPDGSGTYTIPNSDPSISLKASVVMNTYTMYDLDTLVFSQSASSTTPAPLNNWVWIEANTGTSGSPSLTGMHYNVPSSKTHQFKVNGTEELVIGTSIDAKTNAIINVADPTNNQDVVTKAWHVANTGASGVALTDNPTWTGNHVFDTSATYGGTVPVKIQGDGNDSAQTVIELGKYGDHSIKFIGEIAGEGDAVITDPDGSGTYTIPNSDPSVSFKASLVMNTYTMYDLDTLVFSQGASTTTPPPLDNWVYIEADTGTSGSPSLTGMKYNVPSSKTHQFAVNGTDVVTISGTGLSGADIGSGTVAAARLGSGSSITSKFLRGDNTWQTVSSGSTSFSGFTADDDLAMGTFDITGVDSLKFSTASNSGDTVGNSEYGIEIEGAPSSPSRLRFNVPSSKSFSFQVNGSVVSSIGNDGKGTFDGGVNIGNDADGLMLNNSSGNPSVNGHFRTNGSDVKVYSGGAVRNLTDIGSGGGNHTHPASDVVSGVLGTARLGSGTANNTKYLRGDGTWQTYSSGGSGANTTLSNLGNSVSINSDLIPDGAQSLGDTSNRWRYLYVYYEAFLPDTYMDGDIDCNSNDIFEVGDLGSTGNKVDNAFVTSIWQYGSHTIYSGGTQIHNSGSAVSYNGLIQFASGITQTDTSLPSSPAGKIQISAGGGTKYIYYYSS